MSDYTVCPTLSPMAFSVTLLLSFSSNLVDFIMFWDFFKYSGSLTTLTYNLTFSTFYLILMKRFLSIFSYMASFPYIMVI